MLQRVSSTTRRSAQKQQQQQRNPKHQQQQQQQQQCRVVQGSRDTSTEEMEVSIELDTANADEPKLEQEHQQKLLQQQNRAAEVVVANAGEDEGEGQQQPQQKLQQSLPSTAAADEGQSSSSKQKMKPLLYANIFEFHFTTLVNLLFPKLVGRKPTVKFGGGTVMVWGCMSRDGLGPLVRIHGTMDRFQYRDIMQAHMLPHLRDKMPPDVVFQQDNDPKHTSGLMMGTKKTFDSRLVCRQWSSCFGLAESVP
uniref:Transposable element Tcb1 transposase n=1 Tax=Globodera pallida TaxID=36090 RepID=A0A183BPU7_GLOPA